MGCTSSKEQDGASPRTPGKDKAPPPTISAVQFYHTGRENTGVQ